LEVHCLEETQAFFVFFCDFGHLAILTLGNRSNVCNSDRDHSSVIVAYTSFLDKLVVHFELKLLGIDPDKELAQRISFDLSGELSSKNIE
jgi:hypothetical protein